MQETATSSATGPFDVDDFVEKMVTWIIADDMVRVSHLTNHVTHACPIIAPPSCRV